MRKSWADAERVAEVREAARSWSEAGAIDADTRRAIEAAYPDARHRLSTVWVMLIFFLVSVAVNAAFFGMALVAERSITALAIVSGLLLAIATEILRSSPSAGNGADAAASFSALIYLLAGAGMLWSDLTYSAQERTMITLVLGLAALLCAAACLHWGYAAYGGFAAGSLFLLLGRFPAGRVWWILAGAILLGAVFTRLDRPYPPPIRRGLATVFAVSAIALYVAVNRYSLDHRWIEEIAQSSAQTSFPTEEIRAVSTLATALLPLAFLSWGIRSRRTLVLDLGLAFTAASLVTLRFYVHVAPLWALLSVGGAVLILGAIWLNRFLRLAPGGERRGFTADPLFTGQRGDRLQAAAVLAGFAPAAARPVEDGGLAPGGGRFGGGGASGEF